MLVFKWINLVKGALGLQLLSDFHYNCVQTDLGISGLFCRHQSTDTIHLNQCSHNEIYSIHTIARLISTGRTIIIIQDTIPSPEWTNHYTTSRKSALSNTYTHEDVIKWKPFPRNWPLVRHKGQWRGAFMFSLIWAWINSWVNNGEAGTLRRHRAHCDVTVMLPVDFLRISHPRMFFDIIYRHHWRWVAREVGKYN